MADASKLAAALQNFQSEEGLAPYGIRHSGEGVKGKGYFGMLPHASGGTSTEISTESDIYGKNTEHPLIVPTLNAGELQHLLAGNQPTDEIYRKAQEHAVSRIDKGLSPFAQPNELRYPVPKD
jgi:hypothetical protein